APLVARHLLEDAAVARLERQPAMKCRERRAALPVPEIYDPEVAEDLGVEELALRRLLAHPEPFLRSPLRERQRQAEEREVSHPAVLAAGLLIEIDRRLEVGGRLLVGTLLQRREPALEGVVGTFGWRDERHGSSRRSGDSEPTWQQYKPSRGGVNRAARGHFRDARGRKNGGRRGF